MSITIKPTRAELINLKKRIKLAKSGHSLLKKKRDGLILEFFKILERVKNLRQELVEEYKKAVQSMKLARIIESDLAIKSIAMSVSKSPSIDIGQKNIMGVIVPTISYDTEQPNEVMFGIYNSSAITETALAYKRVVEKIIIAAEIETSMKKLLKEIEKTKRRVNALEFEIIPSMERLKAFISFRLEEIERENIFRLKMIKRRIIQ
ncbi:MAG: V-type ATP synthase subunit D [Nanoarchaeota archaeon]